MWHVSAYLGDFGSKIDDYDYGIPLQHKLKI